MWLLNGSKSTRYAAAWTLVNAHELAVISGMAAAYTLGASVSDVAASLLPEPFSWIFSGIPSTRRNWRTTRLPFFVSACTSYSVTASGIARAVTGSDGEI
jgi:hypothetical protein